MNKDRILELMTRKLSGEATPEELRELQDLLSSDAGAGERGKILDQFWSRRDDETHPSVEENLRKVLGRLQLPATAVKMERPARQISQWVKVAAAVVILLAIGAIAYLRRPVRTEGAALALMMEKRNAKGTKSIIQLPDGSKIWLNADSKLKYPEIFKGATREIYLNGEAFFDVAKNTNRPFIIHLANGTVQVLGTSFNVRAYDNESVVETSVATGRIAFIPKYRTSRKKQDTVFLAPDHKVSYTFTKEELSTSITSGKEDKAWTEGKLIFRGLTMQQIAMELERNFGKKVVFLDDGPKEFIFTGSFENNSLDEIMYYLSRTKNFNYKITNSELLIAASAGQLP
ncbi:FecR domain-containing protein [Flavitalea sp. BT771]|uniref:FecR domain-containing protein n=1 Tax=Flavitalea sp. BT771 TaxID=3063329 RepID=UPI0026E2DCDC|nr:FecR domain-containing protein [Flavitalea sp. BT771]MDO6429263.1 FecR domain-containing protein [Flavitalea sp. BT771]MDV6218609.1 FecR domain-containing protein [Flavitalea sp. BT771]